jgi:hypothetical protein
MSQVPRGPRDRKCPWWHRKMSDVCHTCPLWIQVRGSHPQSGEALDRWDCAMAWMPMLLIENSQMQRCTAASVDKVAGVLDEAARIAASRRGLIEAE